jgi:hypothetical protein
LRSFKLFQLTEYPLLFGGGKAEIHPYPGLRDNGPFQLPDTGKYPCDEISIIGPDVQTNRRFLAGFSKGEDVVFPGGFNSIFKTNLSFGTYVYSSEDATEIFRTFNANGTRNRFPIIIARKTPKSEYDSLYYRIKGEFLRNGIASQIFTKYTMATASLYKWSVFPTAIQVFAKMGGRPYVLARPAIGGLSSREKALVLGVGLTRSPTERRSLAGFVTIYDENGQWMVLKSDTQDSFDKVRLASRLGEMISDAIREASSSLNFDRQAELKLILHYSGKELSGYDEAALIQAIQLAKDGLGLSATVFVAKVKNSNFIASDPGSSCTDPRFGGATGLLNTGHVFKIKDFYTMFTSGCISELKSKGRSMSNVPVAASPNPLIISFKTVALAPPAVSPDGVAGLQQQILSPEDLLSSVYAMCRMNYSSINNPLNRFPVTIKYSREIAWMTLKLGGSARGLETIPWFI